MVFFFKCFATLIFDIDVFCIVLTNFFLFIFQFFYLFFYYCFLFLKTCGFVFFYLYDSVSFQKIILNSIALLYNIFVPFQLLMNKVWGSFVSESLAEKLFDLYDPVYSRSDLFFGKNKFMQLSRLYNIVVGFFDFDSTFVYRRVGLLHIEFVRHRYMPEEPLGQGGFSIKLHVLRRQLDLELSLDEQERQPFGNSLRSRIDLVHNYSTIYNRENPFFLYKMLCHLFWWFDLVYGSYNYSNNNFGTFFLFRH